MPRGDGTGPRGQGSMTGRGMGPCGRGYAWRGRGQGWGPMQGQGYGARQGGFPWWIQQSDDKEAVIERLEGELEEIKAAIKELKGSDEPK